jgi:hypothetical protein
VAVHADASEGTRPPGPDHAERRFEAISTVILALAALATAWAGYQASLWDGEQSALYEEASSLRTQSVAADADADDYRLADIGVFENYVDARLSGDEPLAEFYRQRFRPELELAYQAWVKLEPWTSTGAPPSPLAMPEYQLPRAQDAEDLSREADRAYAEGQDANGYSDVFTLGTVLFATALFFAAISERFDVNGARWTLLGLAALALVGGVTVVALQPVTFGWASG